MTKITQIGDRNILVTNNYGVINIYKQRFERIYDKQKTGTRKVINVAFRYDNKKTKEVLCEVFNGKEKLTINLNYKIKLGLWENNITLDFEDAHYHTLVSLESYINAKYEILKSQSNSRLSNLINDIQETIDKEGLRGLAKKIFDNNNLDKGVPCYDRFIEAFEHYSDLTKDDYVDQIIGTGIHFKTKDKIYEMVSYEGRTQELKFIIEGNFYDEIYTMTDQNILSEIYIDAGIEKEIFIPQMLKEWSEFWEKKYENIYYSVGSTEHLDPMKELSWIQFQTFTATYDCGDLITLACEIDKMDLYPIVVITMLKIFNADVFYEEYCELEFFSGEKWKSIWVNEDDENCPILFIREYEGC